MMFSLIHLTSTGGGVGDVVDRR